MKKIAIFGSTGSIGESTLNVIRENPDLFKVVTLVAGKNIEKLIQQIEEFKPFPREKNITTPLRAW